MYDEQVYGQQVSFTFQGKQFFEEDVLPMVQPQTIPPRPARETLPTMYDLPSEFPEEPGLPDEFHDLQPQLLSRTLQLNNYARQNYFTASDLNVYYYVKRPLWHKRPDWFLAVDVPRMFEGDLRRSYVLWQEGPPPHVVVEFLSEGTEKDDLGRFWEKKETTGRSLKPVNEKTFKTPGKLEVYERYLRVPHYIVYSRHSGMLRYFKLQGSHYEEQVLSEGNCRIWIDDLQIGLGVWEGEFDEALDSWLRWCTKEGKWLLTDTEEAQQAEKEAQQAEEEAQQAKKTAETRLLNAARNLLATGMDTDAVAELLELTEEQKQQLIAEA